MLRRKFRKFLPKKKKKTDNLNDKITPSISSKVVEIEQKIKNKTIIDEEKTFANHKSNEPNGTNVKLKSAKPSAKPVAHKTNYSRSVDYKDQKNITSSFQGLILYILFGLGCFFALLILHPSHFRRTTHIGSFKSPIKIPIRHMWAFSNWQKNSSSVSKTVTKFIKRWHYTGFYYEEKPYQQPTQENNINPTQQLNTNIFESDAYNLANKLKQTELLKNNVKPFALSKDQILTPWKTIPHPTMVHNSILTAIPYFKNIADMEIPGIVITHKVPTKALQQKNNFSVIASVALSPDNENKPQFAILTDRHRTLSDMIKSGYSDKITEWFINSSDIKKNEANVKGIEYLYEIFGLKHNLVKNQLKLTFYANRTLINVHTTLNSSLNPMDLDLVSMEHLELVLKITKLNKTTLLVKSTFTTKSLSSNKKEVLQIESKTEHIIVNKNVNQQEFTTATSYTNKITANKKKLKAPKSKNQNLDDHIEKSKKTRTPIIFNGRIVKNRSREVMRSSCKPRKTHKSGQPRPKNKITEINDDDDFPV